MALSPCPTPATDLTQSESSLGVYQRMTYDADGHQVGANTYARSDAVVAVSGTHDLPNGYVYVPEGGWLGSGEATSYNADGMVTTQVSFQAPDRNCLQIANQWLLTCVWKAPVLKRALKLIPCANIATLASE